MNLSCPDQIDVITLALNPVEPVSYGSFFDLKPIYVSYTTQIDIEMCFCKDHFHGHWSFEPLVKCSRKHDITLPFAGY